MTEPRACEDVLWNAVMKALEDHLADQKGEEQWAHCPLGTHDDSNPSFSINLDSGAYHCFSCGASGHLVDLAARLDVDMEALEGRSQYLHARRKSSAVDLPEDAPCTLKNYAAMKDLDPKFLDALGVYETLLGKVPVVMMQYKDEDGKVYAQRIRKGLSGKDKFLWPPGTTPLPYGLWRLKEAREAGYVLLVEGESDCHTLWTHNIPALGIPGATAWQPAWARHLKDLDVYVWREPGRAGEVFVQSLAQDLPNLKVLGRSGGWKDPSQAHINGEDMNALVQLDKLESQSWAEYDFAQAQKELSDRWGPLYNTDTMPEDPPPTVWLVKDIIEAQKLVMIYGAPGAYKSMLAMDLAMTVIAGKPWLETYETLQADVLWVDLDQGQNTMLKRLIPMKRYYQPQKGRLTWVSFPSEGFNLDNDQHEEDLVQLVQRLGVKLVVIDTFRRVSGDISENDADIDRILGACRRVVEATGATIILIHHSNKNPNAEGQNRARGSTAILGGLDLGLYVERKKDEDEEWGQVESDKTRDYSVKPFAFTIRAETDGQGTTVLLHLAPHDFVSQRRGEAAIIERGVAQLWNWVQERNAYDEYPGQRGAEEYLEKTLKVGAAKARKCIKKALSEKRLRNTGTSDNHAYEALPWPDAEGGPCGPPDVQPEDGEEDVAPSTEIVGGGPYSEEKVRTPPSRVGVNPGW